MSGTYREDLKEKVQHGNFMLPFAQYVSWIPGSFTSFAMHWHKEVEIIYVQSGSCEINIDLEQFVLKEGDIVIVRPCALHSFKQHKEDAACLFSWVFDVKMLCYGSTDACYTKYLSPFQDGKMEYPQVIDSSNHVYKELSQLLQEMHGVCDAKEDALELNIKWRLEKLFYFLFRDVMRLNKKPMEEKQGALKNIRIVLDYIQENYANPLTIEELAEQVHFSQPYFMRFFKKYTGTTCVEYINEYRLEKATELLKTTSDTIMDIAMQVGMHNVSYFNRVFKKKYQMSPKEYRKNILHTL